MSNPKSTDVNMTRRVAEKWFAALKAGDGEQALSCLDDDIVWINNPGEKGLSDIIPWLGEYRGRQAVIDSFVVWGRASAVQEFELLELVVESDEVFAVVHEVATIKATGLNYDIEFIQRFRVANEKIVFWKSYWDTVRGIVPFRGDMHQRLIAAAGSGNLDDAMLLLPFGADANSIDNATAQTVLMTAASRGHTDLVKRLIEYGADVNAVDRRAGVTALHKACQGGHVDAVHALVAAGAFINQQAVTTGHTPLLGAIWFKSEDIVRYLLQQGARVNIDTYYGFTIDDHVAYALRVNQGLASQEALKRIQDLVAESKLRIAQEQEAQILNRAVLANDALAVRAALDAGADLEQRWPETGSFADGHTPLLIAARDGRTEIIRELLGRGADVNAVEPVFGAVPLHKATYNGYLEITKLLASTKGVNLDYQGPSNGYTPLHDALWHGFPECAAVLVERGARIDIVAYDGKLAVDIAREQLGPDNQLTKRLAASSPSPNP